MTDKDLEKITEAIEKAAGGSATEGSKLVDFLFKAISGMSLALVGWTLNSVNDMQQDLVRLSSDAVYMRASLEKLDDFTSKPRFTREDFDQNMTPLSTRVSQNTVELHNTEQRLNQIDLKIQQLEIKTK